MKKIFFIAALGVAGFAIANGNNHSIEKNGNVSPEIVSKCYSVQKENSSEKAVRILIRVTVYTTCGQVYSQVLTMPSYPTDEELIGIADAVQFGECGVGNDGGWDIHNRGNDTYEFTVKK